MDDPSDDLRRISPRRIEVYAGNGFRRWSEDEKAQIVAESLVPGVVVTALASRHGCRASQIHQWRKWVRQRRLALPATAGPAMFARVVAEESPSSKPTPVEVGNGLEVMIGDALVRVRGRPGAESLIDVFSALRRSQAC